jgi:hypothetical protein
VTSQSPRAALPQTLSLFLLLGCFLLSSCGGNSTLRGSAGDGIGSGSSGVNIVAQFDGDTGSGNPPSYKDHPDMAIGANGTQVVETTGQNVMVYSYSGSILHSTSVVKFISAATGTVGTINDPRVIYDPFISRWLFVCSCSENYLIVSATSDATGTWKGVPLSSDSGDLLMRVGFDRNGVYVGEVAQGSPTQNLFALPNADVAWSGAGTVSLAHEAIATGMPFDQIPVVDLNANKSATAPEYFVVRSGPAQTGSNVTLSLLVSSVTWSGLPSSPVAQFSSTPTTIPTGFLYNTPIDMAQPALPNIRGVEDHRLFAAYAYAGTHIYALVASGPCTSNCGSQGADAHDLIFFFDLSIPALTLNQGVKISSAGGDLIFPSLAVDAQGNVAIAATGVSSVAPPSIYEWHQLSSDAPGTIHGPNLLTPGNDSYSCINTPVGWGTYSATVQDASNGMNLWTVQEYGNSSTPCNWFTHIVDFQITGP